MNRRKHVATVVIAGLCALIMILDSKTAVRAAAEAVDLCIRTVVPSLFPLFVFSLLLTGNLHGHSLSVLKPLGCLCGMPKNSEGLLITGLLGGYPTGAQCVAQAYQDRVLTRHDAVRMLGYCSNAGPAFIFGIVGSLFTNPAAPWILWFIQILSAITVGCILPNRSTGHVQGIEGTSITISAAIQKAAKAMAGICGWIVLFRCICVFCEKWFLWLFPTTIQALLIGILELTNGCWYLGSVTNEAIRFVIASVFISFGGICVIMQTSAVTAGLGLRFYIPGKLMQGLLSALLSYSISLYIYPSDASAFKYIAAGSILCFILFLGAIKASLGKNNSSISEKAGV